MLTNGKRPQVFPTHLFVFGFTKGDRMDRHTVAVHLDAWRFSDI